MTASSSLTLPVTHAANRSRSLAADFAELPDPGAFERFLTSVGARTSARFDRLRLRRIRRFARAVDECRRAVAALPAAEIARRVALCRERLRLDGISLRGSVEAAALVRESARRELGTMPYFEQLLSAGGLLCGYAVEMETGEGKTLSAAVAAAVFALAGLPTHVVTTNDYLARRDADALGPLFRSLGLTVGTIGEGMTDDDRRRAYAASVTYASSKEVTFDYLRTRLALGRESTARRKIAGVADPRLRPRLVLRGLGACIVDEADSVLVDEARTPLILSRRETHRVYTAEVLDQALRIAASLEPEHHFKLLRRSFEVQLTDAGHATASDRAAGLGGPWETALFREDLVHKALSALHLLRRDHHYVVRDGKVELVDEHTGRIMADRSLTEGLHQMLEVKERCEPSPVNVVLGKTSFQRFFRRYRYLSGMSGTLTEVAGELAAVYGLKVVKIPTRLPSRRHALPSRLYTRTDRKLAAIARRVAELKQAGRPVLVGTRSIATSEAVGAELSALGIEHVILNAKNPEREADIVAQAGQLGVVTVATGMAGRGTDIKPSAEVIARGGLHVLICEHHDSSRVDRQFFGRTARQGDPGSYEFVVAAADPISEALAKSVIARICRRAPAWTGVGLLMLRHAQRRMESAHSVIRRRLARYDEETERSLAFAGDGE